MAGRGFFTDPQGRVRPLTPKKGAAGGGAVVAVAVAIAVGGGGVGAGAASAGAGADTSIVQTVRAETQTAEDDAAKGKEAEAWLRLSMKEVKKVIKQDLECAVQSHGQVQQFLLRNPCRSLEGVVFALGNPNNDLVAVSVAWVRMRTTDSATRLKKLEDAPGTGDITPIAAEVLQLGGVRFSAQHYASRRDGTLLVIAEADPLRGQPPAILLDAIAHVADELPAP